MKRKKTPRSAARTDELELAVVSSADGIRLHPERSRYNYKANAIEIGSVIADKLYSSVIAHELNHFLVHASTPYGWFLDECLVLENNLVLSYCLDYISTYPKSTIEIPIYDVAKLSGKTQRFHHLRDLCDKYVKPWSHLAFLLDLLEGKNCLGVSTSTTRGCVRSFDLVEERLKAIDILRADEANSAATEWFPLGPRLDSMFSGSPGTPNIFLPDGRKVNIGAANIFEGIATHHESKDSILSSLRECDRFEYWSLWMMTVTRMGKERVNSEKAYADLLNTFYALCDLALFVPAGALYGRLRGPSMTWYDVHPGGRFITALMQATKLGWIEDLETEMLSYQEWLSELVGWPSPKQFLNLGANLKGTSERSKRHANACQIRLDNHSALIVLGKEFDEPQEGTTAQSSSRPVGQFFATHRPMLYTPALGHLTLRPSADSSTALLSQVLDWFFSQFNYQVTQGGSVVYEDLLPADVRYGSYWSNVKSREELIGTLRAAIPLFSPDRFKLFQD